MGQKKRNLQEFLSKHPICCFCGGATPATTRDHLPPSGIFSEHKWPDGYVFPACLKCNNGSSDDDAVIALYSRMSPGRPPIEREREEWLKQLRAFNERFPGEVQKGLLTANQKRSIVEKYGIQKPENSAHGELPILQITPLIVSSVKRFSRKLTLALHYRHSGKIVPRDAWVRTWHWTNFQRIVSDIPQEIFDMTPGNVTLRRDNVLLSDQFDYKYGISDDGSFGAYLASFRKMFLVVGFICFDSALMHDESKVLST